MWGLQRVSTPKSQARCEQLTGPRLTQLIEPKRLLILHTINPCNIAGLGKKSGTNNKSCRIRKWQSPAEKANCAESTNKQIGKSHAGDGVQATYATYSYAHQHLLRIVQKA